MFKLISIGLCLTAGAAAAQDACVTARDLSRGIQMHYAEGDVFVVERGRNGNLILTENYSDGSPSIQFTGAYALYVETEVELNNGRPNNTTLLTIDFGQPSSSLPAPAPGESFTLETTNIFADGSQRAETYTATFGALSKVTFGECSYDMIPASLRYTWPGESDGMNVEYAFFPEIGAAFLTASQFDGEDYLPLNPVGLEVRQK